MSKAAFFIDGAYLDHVIGTEFGGQRIDYSSLTKLIAEQAAPQIPVLRIYYYHCLPYQGNPPTPEQSQRFTRMQGFIRGLQRTSKFEVRLGRLALRGTDAYGQAIFEQKRVDLMLGLDLALLAAKRLITHAFVVAGDSDLIPAITAAKNEGVFVVLVHGGTCHDDLLDEADERVRIAQTMISSARRIA